MNRFIYSKKIDSSTNIYLPIKSSCFSIQEDKELHLEFVCIASDIRADINILHISDTPISIKIRSMLIAPPDSQNIEVCLNIKSLNLSTGTVSILPELSILHQAVKIDHAVSISKPDDSTLFYLYTKGLDKKSTLTLIEKAFLSSASGLDIAKDVFPLEEYIFYD